MQALANAGGHDDATVHSRTQNPPMQHVHTHVGGNVPAAHITQKTQARPVQRQGGVWKEN